MRINNPFTLSILSLTMLSFFFQAYYINVGYAFKLYMILVPVMYVRFSLGVIKRKFYLHEIFLFFTIIVFSVSALYSYDPLSSFKMVLGLVILVLLYVMFITSIRQFEECDFFKSLIIAGIVFNVISLLLYLYGIKSVGGVFNYHTQGVHYGLLVDRGIPRMIGTLKDPNFLIAFNSIFLFFSFYNLNKYKLSKYLLFLSTLSCIFTFSIGGLIAIVCGMFVISFQSKIGVFKLLTLFLTFTASFFTVLELFPEVNSFIEARASSASTGSGRFADWARAIDTFTNYPFGIGIYSFLNYNKEVLGGSHYVHNTYLELLVEGGIQTLLLYFVSLLLLVFKVFKMGVEDKSYEFIFPATVTLLISFFSLSGFASEYWIFYFAVVNFSIYQMEKKKLY